MSEKAEKACQVQIIIWTLISDSLTETFDTWTGRLVNLSFSSQAREAQSRDKVFPVPVEDSKSPNFLSCYPGK